MTGITDPKHGLHIVDPDTAHPALWAVCDACEGRPDEHHGCDECGHKGMAAIPLGHVIPIALAWLERLNLFAALRTDLMRIIAAAANELEEYPEALEVARERTSAANRQLALRTENRDRLVREVGRLSDHLREATAERDKYHRQARQAIQAAESAETELAGLQAVALNRAQVTS